jgi:hypothetical protein
MRASTDETDTGTGRILGLGRHHSHLFRNGVRGAHPVWVPAPHFVDDHQPEGGCSVVEVCRACLYGPDYHRSRRRDTVVSNTADVKRAPEQSDDGLETYG